NVMIVIDSSSSTGIGDPPFISFINANAISIVWYIGRDNNVGVVAFGGKTTEKTDILSMSSEVNRAELEKFIRDIGPKGGEITTDLDVGLLAAEELLKPVSGSKEIIVISDGLMPPGKDFERIKKVAEDLKSKDTRIHFFQVITSYEVDAKANILYDEIAQVFNKPAVVIDPGHKICAPDKPCPEDEKPEITLTPTPTPTPEISYEYPLAAVDTNHFITKYINLTASVTGYNDVTPKLGSDRLVATTRGKPILTTWGFGLGRVASFTTDNGNPSGNTAWASAVYSGENARLISSMINWAIGDPRPREGVVIQAEDIWGGTPGRVVVTSNTLPQVKLDGAPLDLSRTGPTTYEASINLEKEGFHDLSGYGIAVNYPLEYREVGFNEKLNTVIESNGGRVYSEDEVEGLLLLDIKEKAVRTVQEPKSQKEPFLLAALILFLGEVIVRRLKDYRKERPVIEENPPRAAPAVEAEPAG
ncbi:MAG: VWA domain-containing protein, partial [Euryarchaeota archaeon]|nr:VWA domain-containing protein [Euryarchaeota archaeon]